MCVVCKFGAPMTHLRRRCAARGACKYWTTCTHRDIIEISHLPTYLTHTLTRPPYLVACMHACIYTPRSTPYAPSLLFFLFQHPTHIFIFFQYVVIAISFCFSCLSPFTPCSYPRFCHLRHSHTVVAQDGLAVSMILPALPVCLRPTASTCTKCVQSC